MDKLLGSYSNPADLMFKKTYRARMPIISTYSEHELDVIGIPMHEYDEGNNKNAQYDLVTVRITIVDMVEKYSYGIPVRIVDYEEMLEIYNVIQRHLRAWSDFTVTSLNQAHTDVDEDLIVLNDFANEIYGHNKKGIINKNMAKSTTFGTLALSELLMSPNAPKELEEINYDAFERENLAPESVNYKKYDLNSLLN